MATFTVRNFPADVPGNKLFPGTGQRTIYVPVFADMRNYNYADGFKTEKQTKLYSKDGYILDTLAANKKVYFTYPAKLYKKLGKQSGVFAAVSLKSASSSSDGFVSIGNITKPVGLSQARTVVGAATQLQVAEQIEKIAAINNKKYKFIKIAMTGSTDADLIIEYDNKKVQFEIKGTNSSAASITIFDKSVSRKRPVPEIMDNIAAIFKPDNIIVERDQSVFLATIAYYNSKNDAIGLAGDGGNVPKSGKLPSEFKTTDVAKLRKLKQIIVDSLKEKGDNYLVIHDRSRNTYKIYALNKAFNPLGYSILPPLKSFSLGTYGGASGNSTRIGLKIRF